MNARASTRFPSAVDASELNSYAKMIEAVVPAVRKVDPNVKIFGTENMLELEGQPYFYSQYMDSAGWGNLDILAYHGYQASPRASAPTARRPATTASPPGPWPTAPSR